MKYEAKIYKILNENRAFVAKSKETGRKVSFKTKDAMRAAIKGGSHEPLDKPSKPKGTSVEKPRSGDYGDPAQDPSPEVQAKVRQANEPQAIELALQGTEEGIYDAIGRGMSFGDNPDVDAMIIDDIQSAIDAGATDDDLMDFSNNLDSSGRNILQSALDDMGKDLDIDADSGSDKSPGERDTKGSENPFDDSDDDDNDFYGSVTGADLDQNIADAADGIIPDKREQAFNSIILSFNDDEDVKEIYDNLEADKIPKASEDPFGAIKHSILMQGIEDGAIDFGDTGMTLANYIETREDDLYLDIMGESKKPWVNQYNRLFESLK